MAVAVESSALGLELRRITAHPGSPYYKLEIFITAGGRDLHPLQVVKMTTERDYKVSYMDDHEVTLQYGAGTAFFDIAPYQDDLTITIKKYIVGGFTEGTAPPAIEARTYTAYLTDDLPRGAELSSAPQFADRDTANRSKTMVLTFVLEEVAITQLRKMSIGTIVRATPPYMVLKTFINNALNSIQLGAESKILGFQMEEPSNKLARDHIVINDGTQLIDLPDLLQNEQGGIYSSGLGFYIQGKYVYAWPVYDTSRLEKARRVLQVFLSPTHGTSGIDKTWTDDGRCVSIWSSGAPKVLNDSVDVLNNEGNAVRFADASKLIGGMGTVKNNTYTMNRSTNNTEVMTTVMGNGGSHAKRAANAFSANPFVETSRMARRNGQFMLIPWERSNPDLLIPSMAVEIYYDAHGEIKTMTGVMTGNSTEWTMQGRGPTARTHATKTMVEVFMSRDDPDFKAYLANGGTVSGVPKIEAL